jgi:hypothetical protein
MIIPEKKVQRIASFNMERCYIGIQNTNSTAGNLVYLMQSEEEPETFKNAGFALGGYGILEIQRCINAQSKKAWFAYTEVVGGIDLRVLDI